MSETKNAPSIHVALAAVKAEVGAVAKTGRNQQQGYNFRGVDAVVNAAAPELNKQGVIVAPMLQSIDYDTVEVGKNRTPMAHVRVIVTYRFHGPAGDYLDATVPGESMDSGDKAAPKAMSVAYRIALLQALNLPTSDPDPDTQTYERSPREQGTGDEWRNQPPVNRPRGTEGNGHVARPAQAQQQAAPAGEQAAADPDPDAQVHADEAAEARSLDALRAIHKQAFDGGHLGKTIRNPATGNTGPLGPYLEWRRKQLTDDAKAWKELQDAAGQMPTADLDKHVQKVTGSPIEGATAAQLREAAKALAGAPA
jgi:hypothetical protein